MNEELGKKCFWFWPFLMGWLHDSKQTVFIKDDLIKKVVGAALERETFSEGSIFHNFTEMFLLWLSTKIAKMIQFG